MNLMKRFLLPTSLLTWIWVTPNPSFGQQGGSVESNRLAQAQQETRPYDFVAEYVRQLGVMEGLRSKTQKEFKEDTDKFASTIRSCSRFNLELSTDTKMLETMRFSEPFESLITNITI